MIVKGDVQLVGVGGRDLDRAAHMGAAPILHVEAQVNGGVLARSGKRFAKETFQSAQGRKASIRVETRVQTEAETQKER